MKPKITLTMVSIPPLLFESNFFIMAVYLFSRIAGEKLQAGGILQRETTPFHPYSPYTVARQCGFWMVNA